jgi:ketosteroid isomerase-like protein
MSTHLARLDALVAWYEGLAPESLAQLPDFYAEDTFFKDPFHEFRSREKLHHVYAEMFRVLQSPRFAITSVLREGDQAFLVWDMSFAVRGRPMCIHGSTHLVFAADGRVAAHRDYWDAAAEVYEKLPVLGWLLRTIRKRVQAQ